jgi:hypothetical protein
LCSLRLFFVYFIFNGLSNIIFLQKQDLRILGMQTMHSAHQLRQQRNISSLKWTVKSMSRLQHIKLNETENRNKLHHILSSEKHNQVTARNLDNNKTKAGDTLSSRHVSSCDVTRAVGIERRFNIEFYGANSHFCHSAYVTWSHVSRPELHVRSRDVSRVTEVWMCAIEFNVKSPLTSQSHA